MIQLLDYALFFLHVAVIGFNLFGWIPRCTRKYHLWVVALTLGSWLLLGLKYGLGYCFLTDLHWQVKRNLGETNLPHSFITYLFDSLGISISGQLVDYVTVIPFVIAIVMSTYFNFFKKKKTL